MGVLCTVLVFAVAFNIIPQWTPIFTQTKYSFGFIAAAAVLYILAGHSQPYSALLKVGTWVCLCLAFLMAIEPLRDALSALQDEVAKYPTEHYGLAEAYWYAFGVFDGYSEAQIQAMYATLMTTAIITPFLFFPVREFQLWRIEGNRKSKTGPWQANWMDRKDIAYLKRNETGLPLALHKGKLLRYQKDDYDGWRGGHHLVVSGTRGGKGVSAVIPAILDHDGPVVVLDIKGENFAVTRGYRESLGRKVAVLNPFGIIENGRDGFNPLQYIRPEELARDVALVADGLVKPERGEGAHFSDMARQLVEAAIEVVVKQETEGRRNLITVADLLLSANIDTTLEAWADSPDIVGHRPAQIAATILQAGDRERGSIQTSVSKAFEWMQSGNMRQFLSWSDFHMDDILHNGVDIFIAVPLDQVDKQAIFMRLFINLVLGTVVRQDGRTRVEAPILLVLDEFVRMGRMQQITNIANVAAGVGVEALFVTQDIGQVEKAYGRNDAQSIFGSCITKRVFNINDIETAEWAVRHLGEGTVYSQQIREAKAPIDSPDYSYSEQRQKLMTPEQIINMKTDDVLLMIGNHSPLIAKQNLYFKNRRYDRLYDRNPVA